MLHEPDFLLFASDAMLMALWGMGFLTLALGVLWAERRRNRQDPLDRIGRVGWMPWSTIFIGCLLIGGGLLAYSLPTVLFG